MKAKILIRRKIKARDSQEAINIIKIKYPRAKLITYFFDFDFRHTSKRDYDNRTMTVAFVDDTNKIFF